MARQEFCLCQNIDCPRNSECARYINEAEYDDRYYCIMEFENICFERNNYKFFEKKY